MRVRSESTCDPRTELLLMFSTVVMYFIVHAVVRILTMCQGLWWFLYVNKVRLFHVNRQLYETNAYVIIMFVAVRNM